MTATKLFSHFAQFAAADIKGGAAMESHRRNEVMTAINQALKGNFSPIVEASKIGGKAKKARAYAAGFTAVGDVAKVAYKGKLDSPENKEARDQIASQTKHLTETFFTAFDAVMAEKAAPRQPKADTVKPDDSSASTTASQTTETAITAADAQNAAIATVLSAIKAGLLADNQLADLGAALAEAGVVVTVTEEQELQAA